MPRVIHFEVSADDTERASDFYSKVFGWNIQKWGGPRDYRLIITGADDQPGINGGIFKRDGATNYVNTIDVPSVDEFVARIAEHGGKEVVPKTLIPGVGQLVYCQDTEGNVFGVLQPETEAQ
jgi:predicted enzyme related to lactoylglutathione lyase